MTHTSHHKATPPEGPQGSVDGDMALLKKTIVEAGRLALTYFTNDPKAWEKSPDNPVSEADIAVNNYIKKTLQDAYPDYGWLSEEDEDSSHRQKCNRIWIVDPIDGTRAFLRGDKDWGVSIALTEGHDIILAAFYVPTEDALYTAAKGAGAQKNGQDIHASNTKQMDAARMMGDPSSFRSPRIWPIAWPDSMETIQINSIALRLALVAEGKYDACVSLRPKNEWDIAAADLIVREAGGLFHCGNSTRFVYNQVAPINDRVIASNKYLMPQIMERVVPAIEQWQGCNHS